MIEDFSNLKDDIRDYINIRLEQMKLEIAEGSSRILSRILLVLVSTFLLLIIFLFLSFAAAYFLGTLLQSTELGFLLVAGFYSLILILVLYFRRIIFDRPAIQYVLSILFQKNSNDETE
jgi:hypothetical protein